MSKRKSITVDELIDYANLQLSYTNPYCDKKFKECIVSMIEHFLHETGQYNGFMFLNNDDSTVNTIGHLERKYFKANGKI